ncbi:MAG: DUF5658 family protein [Pyrinomonadaceae bacterium]
MNWLDAQLTILWIRLHIASEGNGLMAKLLSHGDSPFLVVKLAIGAFAALVLYRCYHMPIAKRGMTLVLGLYCVLMVIHAATGWSARGWHAPAVVLSYFGSLPGALFSLFY